MVPEVPLSLVFDVAASAPRSAVIVYADSMTHHSLLSVRYGALEASTASTSTLFHARGQRSLVNYMPAATALSLKVDQRNPLWARWRYAALNNVSLRLSNAEPFSHLSPGPRVHLNCKPTDSWAFCESAQPLLASNADTGQYLGNYTVVVNPEQQRSQLPPYLYFLLSNGRARWHRQTDQAAGSLSLSEALATRCVDLSNGLRLCDSDIDYFDLRPSVAGAPPPPIVLGNTYWLARYSAAAIDGWASTLDLEVATSAFTAASSSVSGSSTTALKWAAAIFAGLTLTVTYGRWITAPQTPSAGLLAFHLTLKRSNVWVADYRTTLGLGLLLIAAIGDTLICTLNFVGVTDNALFSTPNFQLLVIGLLAYGWLQTVVSFVAAFMGHTRRGVPRRLIEDQKQSLTVATLRHLCHATGTLAFASAALVPLAYEAVDSGSMILLFLLLPPTLKLLYDHAYYNGMLASYAFCDLNANSNRRAVYGVAAIVEYLVFGGITAILTIWLINPLIDSTSPFFGSAWNFLAAIGLEVIVIAAANLVLLNEVTIVLKKIIIDRKTA